MNYACQLTSSQIQSICRQTNLIGREVQRRHDQFLRITTDGKMTKDHFKHILQNIWPTGNIDKFSSYLFELCDRTRRGFIEFTPFICIHHQLTDDKSYLGFLFDMHDISHKGFLSRKDIEALFASFFELTGYGTSDQHSANISQQKLLYLMHAFDSNNNRSLSRNAFINLIHSNWIDEDNGFGTLLTENFC